MKYIIAVLAAAMLASGAESPAERAIVVAQGQIAKFPTKADGYNSMALALARRARETSDPGFYAKAEELLKKSNEVEPDNFGAKKMRVWLLLGNHEFAAARELAMQLNKKVPDDVLIYGFLTDANVELGNYKEAEYNAQWLLDMGRVSVPGLTRAAYLRELFGDLEGSLELMNTAYRRTMGSETEDRAWLLTQIGHLLTQMGQYESAGRTLDQALTIFPDYHYALARKGELLIEQKQYKEAVALFRKRVQLAPHAENYFDLGAALSKAGEKEEAAKVFAEFETRARAEMNKWDNANRELIRYYSDYANDPAEALRIAEREVNRRKDVHTLDAYAWALYRNGKKQEARQQIKSAIDVGVKDPEIRAHAATIEGKA